MCLYLSLVIDTSGDIDTNEARFGGQERGPKLRRLQQCHRQWYRSESGRQCTHREDNKSVVSGRGNPLSKKGDILDN